jgi:hypothetical protein
LRKGSNVEQTIEIIMSTQFIKDLFDWASQNKTQNNFVTVQMNLVSNQQSGVCTYAIGTLYFQPGETIIINSGGFKIPRYIPPGFATSQNGPLKQYFSDRLYVDPRAIKAGDPGDPFDPTSTDTLGASISFNNDVVLVTLHFFDQGNTTVHFPANGISDVLYGNQNTYDPTLPVYLISLTQRNVQKPIS